MIYYYNKLEYYSETFWKVCLFWLNSHANVVLKMDSVMTDNDKYFACSIAVQFKVPVNGKY